MLGAAHGSSRDRRSIEEDPMRHSLALLISSALAVLAAFWFVSAADAAKKKTDKTSVSEISHQAARHGFAEAVHAEIECAEDQGRNDAAAAIAI